MEGRNSGNFLNARYWSCVRLFQVLIIAGFCIVAYKAFHLQVIEYSTWQERARAQVETRIEVPAYRGTIYDRKGRILSYSVPQFSLFANSDQVESPKQLASRLGRILGCSEEILFRKLTCNRHFVWIKRHLKDQQAIAIGQLKAKGLSLVPEYKRFYPHRHVAGQVLGFVGIDGIGQEGIEKGFDKLLRQDPQTVGQFRDGVRKCLWLQPCPPPEPSESLGLRTSLDAFIQYVSEFELDRGAQQYNARAAEVVVLDAQTSEVLAMANWPLFDPNLPDKRSPESWRNRAITDFFEPGSTFKVFMISAALQEGIVRERDRIFCENGKCKLAGHMINDVHPYGWLTVAEAIKHSSNIAASKIALQLGNERYYRYIKSFGFGTMTSIGLPGEAKGLVRYWKRWRPIDLATTGFGQSIGVTSLQLSQAVSCIARGGEYVQPYAIKEVVDANGRAVRRYQPPPSHMVVHKKTADIVRDMMKSVTEEGGTGVNAAPPGYSVAGKTGTAQVLDPVTKRYASNRYTSVFTGFVPAEQPRLVITVAVHDPHGAIYGGVVAAPIFRNIAARVLPYLGVPPHFDPDKSGQPKVVNASAGKAPKAGRPLNVKEKTTSSAPQTSTTPVRQVTQKTPIQPRNSKPLGVTKPSIQVQHVEAAAKPERTSMGIALNESDAGRKNFRE